MNKRFMVKSIRKMLCLIKPPRDSQCITKARFLEQKSHDEISPQKDHSCWTVENGRGKIMAGTLFRKPMQ